MFRPIRSLYRSTSAILRVREHLPLRSTLRMPAPPKGNLPSCHLPPRAFAEEPFPARWLQRTGVRLPTTATFLLQLVVCLPPGFDSDERPPHRDPSDARSPIESTSRFNGSDRGPAGGALRAHTPRNRRVCLSGITWPGCAASHAPFRLSNERLVFLRRRTGARRTGAIISPQIGRSLLSYLASGISVAVVVIVSQLSSLDGTLGD
jgi:hypothetical protein